VRWRQATWLARSVAESWSLLLSILMQAF